MKICFLAAVRDNLAPAAVPAWSVLEVDANRQPLPDNGMEQIVEDGKSHDRSHQNKANVGEAVLHFN